MESSKIYLFCSILLTSPMTCAFPCGHYSRTGYMAYHTKECLKMSPTREQTPAVTGLVLAPTTVLNSPPK